MARSSFLLRFTFTKISKDSIVLGIVSITEKTISEVIEMSRNKYHARKIVRNGETFDSEREYRRYVELSLLQKAGKIQGLQRQVPFELIPAQYEEVGKKKKGQCLERAVKYVADFIYLERGQIVVEDTKGFKTKDYILKRKMMLYFHGIRIKEV